MLFRSLCGVWCYVNGTMVVGAVERLMVAGDGVVPYRATPEVEDGDGGRDLIAYPLNKLGWALNMVIYVVVAPFFLHRRGGGKVEATMASVSSSSVGQVILATILEFS